MPALLILLFIGAIGLLMALYWFVSNSWLTGLGGRDLDPRHWSLMLTRSAPQYQPEWSPDGTRIVFGSLSLFAIQTDGSGLSELFVDDKYQRVTHSPDISPDGIRVVYVTTRHTTNLPKHGHIRTFDLETSNIDGTDRQRLTESVELNVLPAWSPDGKQLAFARLGHVLDYRISRPGLYAMGDGGNIRQLVTFPVDVWSGVRTVTEAFPTTRLVWSPDGESLAYVLKETEIWAG